MGTCNALNMRGYHPKYWFIKPLMTLFTRVIEQQCNRQLKRSLWYPFFQDLKAKVSTSYTSIFGLAGRFCTMGTTSWSIQDVQLSLEKLRES